MANRRTLATLASLFLAVAGMLMTQPALLAQGRGRGAGAGPPRTPQAAAPIDLTGYWVSVITEDWRYRMVLPRKGDYEGVPLTPAAKTVADAWDPDKEEASGDQCKSYGAPAILRVPGRLHFTWQDDTTLKMDVDAGQQTRVFHFGNWKPAAGAPHTLQGDSVAMWEGGGRGATDGSMKVVTTNLKGGYLRKNGVPYGDNTELTEYYEVVTEPNGTQLLLITISTTDPQNLRQPFVISSQYKKEPDGAKWHPTPCSAKW